MSLIIMAARCHYCSRNLSPSQIIKFARDEVMMCQYCYDVHGETLDKFCRGAIPTGCQQCGITYEALEEISSTKDVRMAVVWKDRVYQVLCGTCSDAYLPKRGDLFKGTQFGRESLNL